MELIISFYFLQIAVVILMLLVVQTPNYKIFETKKQFYKSLIPFIWVIWAIRILIKNIETLD